MIRGSSNTKSRAPSVAPSRNSALLRTAAVRASTATMTQSSRLTIRKVMPMRGSRLAAAPGRQQVQRAARQGARQERQRQGDHDAPEHEVGTEEGHFPDQGAIVAEQIPGRDEGDRGAGVGAQDQER